MYSMMIVDNTVLVMKNNGENAKSDFNVYDYLSDKFCDEHHFRRLS